MDFLGIQGNIGSAIQDAPKNFLLGIAHAAMFVPDKLKGAVVFGESWWNGLSPEQQAVIEEAITKLIIEAATAYVGSKKQ